MLSYPFDYHPATMSFSLEASILKYFGNLEHPRTLAYQTPPIDEYCGDCYLGSDLRSR